MPKTYKAAKSSPKDKIAEAFKPTKKSYYDFIFNLKTGKLHKPKKNDNTFKRDAFGDYAVRYRYTTSGSSIAEIGDGYRHECMIAGGYWNRLLKIIREEEVDASGLEAILSLLSDGLPKEYEKTFVTAVKAGKIKDI
ncbi:MAG: hypothetical protein HY438_01990 [DPANN group archaeon]|nr:hypothetical protein [DPANN group archaeon]